MDVNEMGDCGLINISNYCEGTSCITLLLFAI